MDHFAVAHVNADVGDPLLAEALPGTGEIMRSVSVCFAMSWHAAKGGNWDLGAYYLRRTRSLLRGLVVTRPKYAAELAEFDAQHLEGIYVSIIERRAVSANQATPSGLWQPPGGRLLLAAKRGSGTLGRRVSRSSPA